MSQTSHRQLQTSHIRVTDSYRQVTGESQMTTDNSQTSHRQLQQIISKVFFEWTYKTLFSQRIWFANAPIERWFLTWRRKVSDLKFIEVIKTLLHKKSDKFKLLTSFSLDIRALSTETQTNTALLLYSRVLIHSGPLTSFYNHWKYLKLSFFDVFRGHRKILGMWSVFKQPFADVLQNWCS